MTEDEIETDLLVDEILAQDFLEQGMYEEDAYDRWRDDQCDALYDDLKALVDKHLHPKKHGYYKEMPERFLEHVVDHLKQFTNCELTAFENRVTACKKEPVKVEVVETFKEDEDHELRPRATMESL